MKKQDTPAMNIVWRDISELTPYERNAKLHPDEQIVCRKSSRKYIFN